jgi:hypothetical protein
MYIPWEASSWTLLRQNRKLSSRISCDIHVHVSIIRIKLDNVLSKHGCKTDVFYDYSLKLNLLNSRLAIGTSRTVGSAKKFVRITSGFGAGEFTKTLPKVCTCQKLKFAFLLLEYCKIRECYAVANAFTIRNMYSLLLSACADCQPWV